jgi:hypothetical protein
MNCGRASPGELVFLELRGYLDYNRLDYKLSYWRSRSQSDDGAEIMSPAFSLRRFGAAR